MNRSQQRQAAKAFTALRALDTTSGGKLELVAAGFNRGLVIDLYPETEFAVIAMGLITRLPQIRASKLSPITADICRPALNGFLETLPQPVQAQVYAGFEDDAYPDETARLNLGVRIDERSGMLPMASAGKRQKEHMPTYGTITLTDTCWWAWWSMSHRESLPRQAQTRADALMLIVNEVFDLSS